MAFDIVPAIEGDAAEVADVHLRAMEDNALLHAQFPNTESWTFLREWLQNDTVQHVNSGSKGVVIAKNGDSKDIASFVKWEVHGGQRVCADQQPAQTENWPDCCRTEYLEPYGELTARKRKQFMGDAPYYRMSQLSNIISRSRLKAARPTGIEIVNEAPRCDISLHRSKVRWPGGSFPPSSPSARTSSSGRHGCCAREYNERRDFLSEAVLQQRAGAVHDAAKTGVG